MKHPPFKPGPSKGAADYLTKAGAERLAETARVAWSRVGHDVAVEVHRINESWGKDLYCLRFPGLVNGLPTR